MKHGHGRPAREGQTSFCGPVLQEPNRKLTQARGELRGEHRPSSYQAVPPRAPHVSASPLTLDFPPADSAVQMHRTRAGGLETTFTATTGTSCDHLRQAPSRHAPRASSFLPDPAAPPFPGRSPLSPAPSLYCIPDSWSSAPLSTSSPRPPLPRSPGRACRDSALLNSRTPSPHHTSWGLAPPFLHS